MRRLPSRSVRSIITLLACAALIAAGCSSSTDEAASSSDGSPLESVEQSQDPGLPSQDEEDAQDSVAAEAAEEQTPEPAPTGTSVPAPTVVSVPESTNEPLVVPTPSENKNQPVFRQARVDGDSLEDPTVVTIGTAPAAVNGEVSAFTDRVDVLSLATGARSGELSIRWVCPDFGSEDGRPLRMQVRNGATVLADFSCVAAGAAGMQRVQVDETSSIVVVVDSNLASGAPTSANFFASYELSLQIVSEQGAQPNTVQDATDAGETEPAEPTSQAEEPTVAPVITPTPVVVPDDDSGQEDAEDGVEDVATPTPTSTVDVDPQPSPTPTVEPVAEPTPQPATSGSNESEEPAIGNGRVAPADGDSRANPQRPEQAGFLIGSVSAPTGDNSDWSSFVVQEGDPAEVFAGVVCENFSSLDGSGELTLTIYAGAATPQTLTCNSNQFEDFAPLAFVVGETYLIEATFAGTGYTDWFFQAADDD